MQAKMAGKGRLANRIYQFLFALWVPIFGWSVRHLPLGVLYALGGVSIRTWLLLKPKYARALRSNFARITGEAPEERRVRDLARTTALNHGRYWIDFFYWSERGAMAAQGAIRGIENLESLERCIGSGRGFVALTAHIGNWEMGGLLLGGRAGEIAVVYVPDRFRIIESYRSRYRRSAGIVEVPITDDPLSALWALRVLRAGGVVAVQGDRDFNDSGIPVPFFGEAAYFPRGPAVLSLLSGSPILPVFILRGEDSTGPGSGGFRVVVSDPIEPQGDPREEAAVEALVRKIVPVIERMVRAHPEQWYCFYPFWDDPTRRPGGRPAPRSARVPESLTADRH